MSEESAAVNPTPADGVSEPADQTGGVSDPADPFSDGQASNFDLASQAGDPPSPSDTQNCDVSRPAIEQALG